MPAIRMVILFCISSSLLLGAFQNCSYVHFESEAVSGKIQLASFEGSGTGNGTGYDGKLTTGEYYRLIDDSSCDGADPFFGIFNISTDRAHLLKDGCIATDIGFSATDSRFYQSPYYRDLLAINDAVFKRAVGETKPAKIINAWCSIVTNGGANQDVVVRSSPSAEDYQAIIIQTQKDPVSGLISDQRTESIAVNRSISENVISFTDSDFGFLLDIDLASKSNFRVTGHFKARTSVSDFDQSITCIAPSSDTVVPAPAQLVGFWNFEDQASSSSVANLSSVSDSTSAHNDGTAYNADGNGFTVVAGKFGKGVSLDGNDDFIDISKIAASMASKFTISLWFQTTFSQSKNYLVTASPDGISNMLRLGFGKCFTTISVSEVLSEFGSDCYMSGATPIDTSWHHLVFSGSPTNAVLHLDGVLKDQRATTFSFDANTKWSIGQDYDNLNPTDFYKGNLDEIMIWNSELSAEQIKKLFSAP